MFIKKQSNTILYQYLVVSKTQSKTKRGNYTTTDLKQMENKKELLQK